MFSDAGQMWTAPYEYDNFQQEMENLYLEMKPLYEQVLEYLVIYIYTHLHIIYTYLHNIYTISTNIGARLCPAPSAPSLRAQSGGQVSTQYLQISTHIYAYLRLTGRG